MLVTSLFSSILLIALLEKCHQSPVTIPLKPGGDLDKIIPEYFDTKRYKNFHAMSPNSSSFAASDIDVSIDFSCNIDLRMRWSTMVGSPVYSTPVAFSNGKSNEKQIYMNTYYQYVESLDHDGFKSWGWPLSFEDSSFQTSPLIYDIDGDGNVDLGVVDKNGNLFWVRTGEFGEYLEDYHIQIPKLQVKRDWFVGLDPGFDERYQRLSIFDKSGSHRDATTGEIKKAPAKPKVDDLKTSKKKVKGVASPALSQKSKGNKPKMPAPIPSMHGHSGTVHKPPETHGRRLTEVEEVAPPIVLPAGDKVLVERLSKDVPEPAHEDDHTGHVFPDVKTAAKTEVKTDQQAQDAEEGKETTEEKESEPVAPDVIHQDQKEAQERERREVFANHNEEHEETHAEPHAGGEETHAGGEETHVEPHAGGEETHAEPHAGGDDVVPNHGEGQFDEEQLKFLHGDDDYVVSARMQHQYAPINENEPVAADSPLQQEFIDQMKAAADGEVNEEGREGQDPENLQHYGYEARNTVRSADDGFNYYAGHRYGGMIGEGIAANESKFVLVDAHVLTSPVLSDVNGDGHMEIIFAVSYYFDRVEYSSKNTHFDPQNYVAGGVVCWDMEAQDWTWMVHLDLTTSQSTFQAMIYSTPTVTDLDGDGRYEIIVGTSLGLLYLLDGESGFVRRHFPMQFHSIEAQVAVGDVLGGRDLEIIVGDMGGTLAVVNVDGEILWDVQLTGTLPFTATLGDVDGDGQMDIVAVAVTADKGCHIYALRGDTGETLPGYPIALPEHAKVTSSVLLVDLSSRSAGERFNFKNESKDAEDGKKKRRANKSLHMVVTSFDGHVYIIGEMGSSSDHPTLVNPHTVKNRKPQPEQTHCAQRIDIGEHIYSHPLIDDISGDGYLDIVVGTMNGQVLLFETAVPYNPINSWNSFPKNRLNGFTHGDKGLVIPASEKAKLKAMDIKGGHSLTISFEIFDARYTGSTALSTDPSAVEGRDARVKYSVTVTKGTNRLEPILHAEYLAPGRYSVTIPVNPPESALYVLSMIDDHGQYFEDSVFVSLSTRFYVWLKYMILSPVVVLCVPLIFRYAKYI